MEIENWKEKNENEKYKTKISGPDQMTRNVNDDQNHAELQT